MEKKFKFNVILRLTETIKTILRPQRPLRPFYVHRDY